MSDDAELSLDLLARHDSPRPHFFFPFEEAAWRLGERLLLDVDPRHLELQLAFKKRQEGRQVWLCDLFVGSGDWSALFTPVTETGIYREMSELAGWEGEVRASPPYSRFMARIALGRPVRRNAIVIDSAEKAVRYLQGEIDLLESIRARGIERRPHFDPESFDAGAVSDVRPVIDEMMERNVGVALGPGGELYRFCSGLHRTACVKLLGLDRMPVELRLIHADFLKAQLGQGETDLWMAVERCIAIAKDRYAPGSARGAAVAASAPVHSGGPAGADGVLKAGLAAAPAGRGPAFWTPARDLAGELGGALVIDVDPAAIATQLPARLRHRGRLLRAAGHFLGRGDWRRWLTPVEDDPLLARTADLVAGLSQTSDDEGRRLLALADSIRSQGYKRRRELPQRPPTDVAGIVEAEEGEVGIAIDADGGIHRLGGGRQRFAVARALGLSAIPVEVKLVHVGWLERQIGNGPDGSPAAALERGLATLSAIGGLAGKVD